MKTTLYILTLFLLFQTGFGEEKVIDSNYKFPDFKDYVPHHQIEAYTLSYMQSNNHHSVSLGKIPYMRHISSFFQWNPIQFDWHENDLYNNGNTTYSYLLPLAYSSFAGLYYLCEELKLVDKDYRTVLVVPILLSVASNCKINPQILTFYYSDNYYIYSNVFVKTKLDYFSGQEKNWWRWKPGFGFELAALTGERILGNKPNSYGISLELGLEKPIDFGVANPQSHKLTPYVNFILLKEF